MLWWEWVLCFYAGFGIVFNVILLSFILDDSDNGDIIPELFNPIKIYASYKVNYFGCFMLMLVYHVIFIPFAVCYWVYKLGWLFVKLCTVGRR